VNTFLSNLIEVSKLAVGNYFELYGLVKINDGNYTSIKYFNYTDVETGGFFNIYESLLVYRKNKNDDLSEKYYTFATLKSNKGRIRHFRNTLIYQKFHGEYFLNFDLVFHPDYYDPLLILGDKKYTPSIEKLKTKIEKYFYLPINKINALVDWEILKLESI